MKRIFAVIIFVITLSCKTEKEIKALSTDSIIDKSIEVSGGTIVNSSKISFDFRGRQYLAQRYNGEFLLARMTINDTNDSVFDVLSNAGFERFVNDKLIEVPDSMAVKYTASVNSVHYFSVLPYGLKDAAVNAELLGDESIKDVAYHKIKITFSKDGGGEDYEDEFVYWINKTNYKIDYFAYSYAKDHGIGLRFREAYNERFVNGIRFVDYNNYKPNIDTNNLLSLGNLFNGNKLKLLSKIELEAIKVDLVNN